MQHVLSIRSEKFPSLNHRTGWRNGRVYTTDQYKKFRELIAFKAVGYLHTAPGAILRPYKLMIAMSVAGDYDNYLKAIGDGLQDAGIIDDDKHIHAISIIKRPVKRGEMKILDVWLDHYDGE